MYHFFFNISFSFGHPNWSEAPWVFSKYMLTLSDNSIFCFYFGHILNEQMQVQGRACFFDISQFFVIVRNGEKIGILGEYLPYGWHYYFLFFRMTRMCGTWCLWNLSTFDYIANNSNKFFFKKKNLTSILIIFVYFGALKK